MHCTYNINYYLVTNFTKCSLCSHYPGLLSGGQLMWITDWSKDALLGEASYHLNKYQVSQ
jgi:hypothetical protein